MTAADPSKAEARTASPEDPSAAILPWTEGADVSSRLPSLGSVLGFRDPKLEQAYLRAAHRQGRRYYTISLTIVCVIVISFLWTDPWLVPPELLPTFHTARLYVLIPSCVLLAINAFWITEPNIWIRQSAALMLVFALTHSILLLMCGPKAFQYLELGVLELTLGTPLIMGLPLRWSIPVLMIFGIAFGVTTLYVELDRGPFINFCVDFPVYATLAIAASYRFEDSSRREFIAQALSRKEYSERITTEADRRRWLEVIAGFLRHELKNSMTAISSSIELADRSVPESGASKFLERGRRSVQYMQVLLEKVVDATNLGSALAQQEFEALDLSALVLNYLEEFRSDVPERAFSLDIEPGVEILGHADGLIQMLDKLLNNALEHGSPQSTIGIELRRQARSCSLSVTDTGDPLPQDTRNIFEPFVTHKTARSGAANLGLGLYVAQAIAVNHAGHIRAESLADPAGARFIIELPLAQARPSAREPAVAATALGADAVKAGVES